MYTPVITRFAAITGTPSVMREQGKSLNEVVVDALARGAGVSGEHCPQRDLRDIAGTWHRDRVFETRPGGTGYRR